SEGSQFMAELAGEADELCLGACIGLDTGEADADAGTTGDENQLAGATLLHRWHDSARHQKCPAHIHVIDSIPISRRNVFDRLLGLAQHTARDVDEYVDAAVSVRFAYQLSDLSLVGDVQICG